MTLTRRKADVLVLTEDGTKFRAGSQAAGGETDGSAWTDLRNIYSPKD
jgi:hypothetical protein